MVSHWAQEARSASNLGELGAEAAVLSKTGKICTIVAPTNWHERSQPAADRSRFAGAPEARRGGHCACRDDAEERQEKLVWCWVTSPCTERR